MVCNLNENKYDHINAESNYLHEDHLFDPENYKHLLGEEEKFPYNFDDEKDSFFKNLEYYSSSKDLD